MKPLSISVDGTRGATLLTVYTPDQPGLFYRLAAAISLAGGNIIDARIHTSSDGMALDNFLIQDVTGTPFDDPHQLERLEKSVLGALGGQEPLTARLEEKPLPLLRAGAFHIRPAVFVDNQASSRYTVIEVNARDRPALLSALGEAIFNRSCASIPPISPPMASGPWTSSTSPIARARSSSIPPS